MRHVSLLLICLALATPANVRARGAVEMAVPQAAATGCLPVAVPADVRPSSWKLDLAAYSREAAAHRRRLGLGYASTHASTGVIIRVTAWGGFMSGRSAVVARRDRAGRWRVESASQNFDIREKDNDYLAPEVRWAHSDHDRDALTLRLDALLADACLYQQPTYFPEGDCTDGADVVIEVDNPPRHLMALHRCEVHGLAGELATALWQAKAGPL